MTCVQSQFVLNKRGLCKRGLCAYLRLGWLALWVVLFFSVSWLQPVWAQSAGFRVADLLQPRAAAPQQPAADVAGYELITPESRVDLLASQGQVGLRIAHQNGWHSYWRNPGDSGLPTEVQWQNLPPGLSIGPIAWPVPKRIAIGPLANYGYDGTVLLPMPIQVQDLAALQAAAAQGPDPAVLKLQAQVNWLICNDVCIPRAGVLRLDLPLSQVQAASASPSQATAATADAVSAAFTAAYRAQPELHQASSQDTARILAPSESGPQAPFGAAVLRVSNFPSALQGQTFEIFPLQSGLFATTKPQTQSWQGTTWQGTLPLAEFRQGQAEKLGFVVVWHAKDQQGKQSQGAEATQGRKARQLELPVQGGWPALTTPSADVAVAPQASDGQVNVQANAAPALHTLDTLSFAGVLWFAVLGGLILNLMPCVFPILAIKVLGFAQHAQTATKPRLHPSWFYAVGVVLSFAALALLMLALRSVGAALGWGFQLQSPWMVLFLIVLFSVLSLQFLGLLPSGLWLPKRWTQSGSQTPRSVAMEQLSSGVLAVLVASPCTGPFMGAALGATLTMSAPAAVLVFMVLGAGMALPYVVLGHFPQFVRCLPKPGLWMERLRKILAIPLILTVFWLMWVLWQQWQAEQAARGAPSASARADAGAGALKPAQGVWQAWTPAREQAALQAGKTVFVDYTAAWCITCQVNERLVLQRPAVVRALQQTHVVALRADWTRYDATITQSLERLGRSGVPVYARLRAGEQPLLLPQILDEVSVLQALQ